MTDNLTSFDILNRLSSAYWGKQMYFLQEDGMIYDRHENKYITLEQAVTNFEQKLRFCFDL